MAADDIGIRKKSEDLELDLPGQGQLRGDSHSSKRDSHSSKEKAIVTAMTDVFKATAWINNAHEGKDYSSNVRGNTINKFVERGNNVNEFVEEPVSDCWAHLSKASLVQYSIHSSLFAFLFCQKKTSKGNVLVVGEGFLEKSKWTNKKLRQGSHDHWQTSFEHAPVTTQDLQTEEGGVNEIQLQGGWGGWGSGGGSSACYGNHCCSDNDCSSSRYCQNGGRYMCRCNSYWISNTGQCTVRPTNQPTNQPPTPTSDFYALLRSTWDAVSCPNSGTPSNHPLVLIEHLLTLENIAICIDANVHALNDVTADLTVEGDINVSLGNDKMIVLRVSGTASASGDVVLSARTTQPFKPLPDLLPTFTMTLAGTFTASTSGSMSVQVTAAQASSFMLTDVLSFKNWEGMLETSETAANLKATGNMIIGGSGGFNTEATAAIDAVEGELSVTLKHTGDWKPFPSLLPLFTSPAFEGVLSVESNGSFSFEASVTVPESLPLFNFLDTTGPTSQTFGIKLDREDGSDTPTFSGSFEIPGELNVIPEVLTLQQLSASVDLTADSAEFVASGEAKVNAGDDSLVLDISGQVSTSGEVALTIGATGPYSPLPGLLPGFLISNLQGSFTLGNGGKMLVEVQAVTDVSSSSLPLFDLLGGDTSPTFNIKLDRQGSSSISFEIPGELNVIPEVLTLQQLSASVDLTADSAEFVASGEAKVNAGDDSLVLDISGQVSTSGEVTLDISSTGTYRPLPQLLPEFSMPNLDGSLLVDAEGKVSVTINAQQSSTFSLTGCLEFKDWTGKMSVDSNTILISATGNMRIGSTDGGFDASVAADIDVVEKSLTVQVTHEGGWKPFQSWHEFSSPGFVGTLSLKSDESFSFEASATLPSDIILFDQTLQLRGKEGDTGPTFNVALSSGGAGTSPILSGSFAAVVSVNFGSNIDLSVQVEFDSSEETFTLTSSFTQGDIKPLKTATALPNEIQNALIIQASDDTPAEFTLSASRSELSLQVSSRFTVHVDALGLVSGRISAKGSISSTGFDGWFIGQLDQLPSFISDVPFDRGQWYLSNQGHSCSDTCETHGLKCTADSTSRQSALTASNSEAALAAFREAATFRDDDGVISSCTKIEDYEGYAGAPFYQPESKKCYGFEGTESTCDENENLQHQALCHCNNPRSMYISIATKDEDNISLPGESWTLDVQKGLALSFRGDSILPDICKGDMTSTIGFSPPASMSLTNTCDVKLKAPSDTAGGQVLSEPLGINHFEFKSVEIETSISLNPSAPSFGFALTSSFEIATSSSLGNSHCVNPSEEAGCLTIDIESSITLIAAEIPNGPSMVIDIDGAMHGTWIEPLGLPNFAIANPRLGVGIQIYAPAQYLKAPTWTAMPWCYIPPTPVSPVVVPLPCVFPKRFEWGVNLYWKRNGDWPEELSKKLAQAAQPCSSGCTDIVQMSSDFVYEKAPHSDEILSHLNLPRLGVHFLLTEISLRDILGMGRDVAEWISKMSGHGEIGALVLPDEFDDFLEGVKFGFEVQLSLIDNSDEGGVFKRGLYLYGTAQADLASLGSFSFELNVELRLETGGMSPASFVEDPLSTLRAGMNFNAKVTLPTFGHHSLGEATFSGLISPNRMEMNTDVEVTITGFSFVFQLSIIAGSRSTYDDKSTSTGEWPHLIEFNSLLIDTNNNIAASTEGLSKTSCVPVNHQYNNPGHRTCDCVEPGDACLSDMGPTGPTCIPDSSCIFSTIRCVPVNHQYNSPGEVFCDCVAADNPCLTTQGSSGPHCIPESSCRPREVSCVPVNHQYNNPGQVTCDCVETDNPCLTTRGLSGPHCIPESTCSLSTTSCVPVNHQYNRPGYMNCDCVVPDDPCLTTLGSSGAHCIPESSCGPGITSCVPVNHQFENPGHVTCDCVEPDDPCLTDKGPTGAMCIPDKSCSTAPSAIQYFELVGGATCPDPSVPLTSSWQDCRDAANSLGFSGDAIAHVDYNVNADLSENAMDKISSANPSIGFNVDYSANSDNRMFAAIKSATGIAAGKCLGYDSHGDLYLQSCTGGTNQAFKLEGDKLIVEGGKLPNQCVTADGWFWPKLRPCVDNDVSQKWQVISGKIVTQQGSTAKCLRYDPLWSATRLKVEDCDNDVDKIWSGIYPGLLTPDWETSRPLEVLSGTGAGKCVGYDSHGDLYLQICTGATNQAFKLKGDKLVVEGGRHANKCVKADGWFWPKLRTCDDSDVSQKWQVSSGKIITHQGSTAKCLRFDPSWSNTRLKVEDCDNDKDKIWRTKLPLSPDWGTSGPLEVLSGTGAGKCVGYDSHGDLYLQICTGATNQAFKLKGDKLVVEGGRHANKCVKADGWFWPKLRDCNDNDESQIWQVSSGKIVTHQGATAKCLRFDPSWTATRLKVEDCNDAMDNIWSAEPSVNPGLPSSPDWERSQALRVTSGNGAGKCVGYDSHGDLYLQTCTGAKNQAFKLIADKLVVEGGHFANQCVEADGWFWPKLRDCDDNDESQKWQVSSGKIVTHQGATAKCLRFDSTWAATRLKVETCDDAMDKIWNSESSVDPGIPSSPDWATSRPLKVTTGPGTGKCVGYDSHGDLYLKSCTDATNQAFKLKGNKLVVQGGDFANQCVKADGWFWPKLRPCQDNDSSQKWQVSSGKIVVHQGLTAKCLRFDPTWATTRLKIEDCDNDMDEIWSAEPSVVPSTPSNADWTTSRLLEVTSGNGAGKCVGYDSHGDLYLQICTGATNQAFKLKGGKLVVEGGQFANQCVKADGWFWPKLRPCDDSDVSQNWQVSSGKILTHQGAAAKCLRFDPTWAATRLKVEDCNDAMDEIWSTEHRVDSSIPSSNDWETKRPLKVFSGPDVGKCVGYDLHGDLYLQSCTGATNQAFKLKGNKLVVQGGTLSELCVKADGWFWPKLKPCDDSDVSQKWRVSSGKIVTYKGATAKCLRFDPTWAVTRLKVEDCNDATDKIWSAEPSVNPGAPSSPDWQTSQALRVTSGNGAGKCVGYDSHGDLYLHSCTGATNQAFKLKRDKLAIEGGKFANQCVKADGWFWPKLIPCDDSDVSQKWQVSSGKIVTHQGATAKCLRFDPSWAATRLKVEDCNDAMDKIWSAEPSAIPSTQSSADWATSRLLEVISGPGTGKCLGYDQYGDLYLQSCTGATNQAYKLKGNKLVVQGGNFANQCVKAYGWFWPKLKLCDDNDMSQKIQVSSGKIVTHQGSTAKCLRFDPLWSDTRLKVEDCNEAKDAIWTTKLSLDPSTIQSTGWGSSRPQGCFRSGDNGRFHFNTGAGGNFERGDKILCVKTDRSDLPSCVPVNHQYNNPGHITCDCVHPDDPCFKTQGSSGAHCIRDDSCSTTPPPRASCLPVNHQYDNPGQVTCDCVQPNDPCFTNKGPGGGSLCIHDSSCDTCKTASDVSVMFCDYLRCVETVLLTFTLFHAFLGMGSICRCFTRQRLLVGNH